MNAKRFVIAIVPVFVFALVWNGLVNTVILQEANLALSAFARPAEDRNIALALLLTAGIALAFVWTFRLWAREGSLEEGLVHGAVFALLAGLLVDLNQYLVYPVPASLAAKWFAFGTVEFLVYGVIVSALFQRKSTDRPQGSAPLSPVDR